MASTRHISIATGRGSINPNIIQTRKLRAHCALQHRFNGRVPQSTIRNIFDDKTRPATMSEAITTRRNNLRTGIAAKRRGLDASTGDTNPLKFTRLERPVKFTTPERRPQVLIRPREDTLTLLMQHALWEDDRRAIYKLTLMSQQVCLNVSMV